MRAQQLRLIENRSLAGGEEVVLDDRDPDREIVLAVRWQNAAIDPGSVLELCGGSVPRESRWQV